MVTHPLRSILTGLGVFIGVVSVIWLLAIGEGIAKQAELEIWSSEQTTLLCPRTTAPPKKIDPRKVILYIMGSDRK